MNTLLLTVLTSVVAAFFFRASRLYSIIKGAYYYSNPEKDVTTPSGFAGCLGAMYLPILCLFIILPIFLLFKVEWRIPVFAYIVGATIGNLLGFLIERLFRLPNYPNFGEAFLNQNAFELSHDIGKTWLALGFYLIYNVTILIIFLIIIFRV
ncbi:MAG: hypothetical protein IJR87_08955 [Bacteroidaceae bacterium]|nr:hypothetical protein [Bacteroidaceae bacterium]